MEKRPNGWTNPSSLLGILGFLALVYSGYLTFQKDVSTDLLKIEGRLSVVETQSRTHEKQIERMLDDRERVERHQ